MYYLIYLEIWNYNWNTCCIQWSGFPWIKEGSVLKYRFVHPMLATVVPQVETWIIEKIVLWNRDDLQNWMGGLWYITLRILQLHKIFKMCMRKEHIKYNGWKHVFMCGMKSHPKGRILLTQFIFLVQLCLIILLYPVSI